ncbi:MAG: DUF4835 family protein [Bacteroidales bacterium]|nr:DUF4835 family protein [Bacteroidales bacterium]
MRYTRLIILLVTLVCAGSNAAAQELDARVTINHQQVQGTNTSVFEALEKSLTDLLNDRQWTQYQFNRNERIQCTFAINVKKYDESTGQMNASLTVQSTRPVYNSNYTSTVFSIVDNEFTFEFQPFDQLEFRPDVIDKDLTALIAYYAYIIIGMDLDTMSPEGGTEILQLAKTVCNNAQGLTLSAKGWKPFESEKNRYAIINDYLDSGMAPFRALQYKYYREGLDTMAENVDRGRTAVTEAIEMLKTAKDNKPMSMLPQIWTEYKRDELVGIYQGKGTTKEKESVSTILSSINASQNVHWNKIKK